MRDGDVDANYYFLNDGAPGGGAAVGSSVNAVGALLSATSLINEFATGGVANTSWVVTFPTKHHYVDGVGPIAPFSERFDTTAVLAGPTGTVGQSCDDIKVSMYNREEGTVEEVGNTNFSPAPAAGSLPALCYEANVVDFNNSSVFGVGTNRLALDTSAVGGAGWAQLKFAEGLQTVAGLPVIGFAAQVRTSGDLTANYGSAIEHAITREQILP